MSDKHYSFEEYKFFYDYVADPDIEIRKLLISELSGFGDTIAEKFTEECMNTVAVYEHITSLGLYDDVREAFYDKLTKNEENGKNLIAPSIYADQTEFKLKCIVTTYEVAVGNFSDMAEAVYKTCSSEKYKNLEKAITRAVGDKEAGAVKTVVFGLSMFAVALGSEVFGPFALIPAFSSFASFKSVAKACGRFSLKRSYNKTYKESTYKEPEYGPDTDYSQEYFDPTYVNM